jgi:hypothetical protein
MYVELSGIIPKTLGYRNAVSVRVWQLVWLEDASAFPNGIAFVTTVGMHDDDSVRACKAEVRHFISVDLLLFQTRQSSDQRHQ